VTLPDAARTRIEAATNSQVAGAERLQGGDIAKVWRLSMADGKNLVVKLGRNLAVEGWMLGYLKTHSRAPVPTVHHASDDLLLMDFIAHEGTLNPFAETHLGDVVAALHAIEAPQFGFERSTVVGGLPQPNPRSTDWRIFFRDHRLLAMAGAALESGRLPTTTMTRIEKLCGKLHIWLRNDARPSLIHGDLWGGNILSRETKIVGLVDPALYFADPEIELAFLTLFDTVGRKFFARYNTHHPMRPGFFEERRDIYTLYPLLVHVRLFGGSYVAQVERSLSRYGC
jgi:fructosamine-3-kinase